MASRVVASRAVGGRVRWLERSPDARHLVAALDLRHPAYEGTCGPLVGLVRDRGGLAITRLPFREEWPVTVGPTRLVTTAHLIAWQTGATLGAGRYLDQSADEQLAAAATASGIRVEHAHGADELALGAPATCARFLGAAELAVGTASGEVHVIAR